LSDSHPTDNAQVGDRCRMYNPGDSREYVEVEVVEVGMPSAANECRLDVRVKDDAGKLWRGYPTDWTGSGVRLVVFPPAAEIPAALADFVAASDGVLVAARSGGNTSDGKYLLFCTKCHRMVYLNLVCEESAEFLYSAGDFRNSSTSIEDTEVSLQCGCSDRIYATPKDFEVNW
jgi:hypothetical protein